MNSGIKAELHVVSSVLAAKGGLAVVLPDNNESLWKAQTVRLPVSHPVLHAVY